MLIIYQLFHVELIISHILICMKSCRVPWHSEVTLRRKTLGPEVTHTCVHVERVEKLGGGAGGGWRWVSTGPAERRGEIKAAVSGLKRKRC